MEFSTVADCDYKIAIFIEDNKICDEEKIMLLYKMPLMSCGSKNKY